MNRHERRRQKALTLVAMSDAPSAQIPVDKLGTAGVPAELSILAIFPGDTRPDSERLTDGANRPIKVYAVLSKSPPIIDRIKGDTTADDGASYLLAPSGAARLDFACSGGKFRVTNNHAGELSFVEFECITDCIAAARQAFQRTVLPVIDHLSYVNNCPIFIGSIRFDDVKNHRQTIDYVSPYRLNTISNLSEALNEKMRPVYSMYREAKNASSNFYRFLCYYKILEWLFGKMRSDVFKAAKNRSIHLTKPKQFVVDHPELPNHIRPYVGKPMKDFFDNVLTPQFRDAVAHFVTDDGGILDMSEPEHLENYAGTILISEMCVRAAIADHEALLRQLQ